MESATLRGGGAAAYHMLESTRQATDSSKNETRAEAMEGPSRSCAVRKNPAGAGLPFDFPDRVVQQSEIGEVIEIGIEIAKAMMRTFFTWQGNIRVGQKKELRSVTSSAATPRLDALDVCVLNVEATRFEVLRSAE